MRTDTKVNKSVAATIESLGEPTVEQDCTAFVRDHGEDCWQHAAVEA
jgi:hypothetical protein